MNDFNIGLPSVNQLQSLIKEKKQVELKLTTGDKLAGKILWQDQNCFCLQDNTNQSLLVWHHAIVYLKPRN